MRKFFSLPCLNPDGFMLNTRGNADGIDLNRDYRHLETDEITAHVRWLERQPKFRPDAVPARRLGVARLLRL